MTPPARSPVDAALDRRLKACLPRYRELNSALWDAIQDARSALT